MFLMLHGIQASGAGRHKDSARRTPPPSWSCASSLQLGLRSAKFFGFCSWRQDKLGVAEVKEWPKKPDLNRDLVI